MEATPHTAGNSIPPLPSHMRGDSVKGGDARVDTGGHEIAKLMADVEDLVARVAHIKDPEVARIRDKVQSAVTATRDSIVHGADSVRRQVRQVAVTTDDFVHGNPWTSIGIVALVGTMVGYLAGRRR